MSSNNNNNNNNNTKCNNNNTNNTNNNNNNSNKQRSATLISIASSSSSSSSSSASPAQPLTNKFPSLQLLNPSASPYVSLTPALVSPGPHQQHSSFKSIPSRTTPLALSTSQHTLKTLVGGRYYDEYDEDDQEPPQPISPNQQPLSAFQASFPPSSSRSSTPSSSLGRSQSQTVKAHLINFHNPHLHSPSSVKNPNRLSSALLPPSNQPPHPPLLPSSPPPPHRPFNLFSLHHCNQLIQQKPLLGFCLRTIALVSLCGLIVFSLVWALLPPVDDKDLHVLRIPTSFEALKKLNALLQIYKTANYYRVLSSFVLIYLFLQAFSLPGSMYLSILAGAMFGVQVALPLVSLCVGTGAMLCYLMSYNLASRLVVHLPSLRSRLDDWKLKLSTKTNKLDLFAYLVVIRISPLPPHWVVNLLAPHVGIPLGVFWLTTCLGILPVTLIHTQLGTTLDQMVGPEDLSFLTVKNLTGLGLVAIGVLVPVLIRWYLRQRLLNECPSRFVSTAESRPFSTRIGLSLEEDDEAQDPLGRRHGSRGLGRQSYDNSSFTSLHKLGRVESSDTLVLSSQVLTASSPQTTRPSPCQYPIPSSKASRITTAPAEERIKNKKNNKEGATPLVDQQQGDQPLDETKFTAPSNPLLTALPPPLHNHHPHHLRNSLALPRPPSP